MNISLDWLGDYLQPVPPVDAAAEALTMAGLPVEHTRPHDGDTVLDVEVTSNRPDCLSHVGVARELSALLGGTFSRPDAMHEPRTALEIVDIDIDAAGLCPHYTARVVRGVRVGPSPDWLRRRLEAVGVRSINNVVDVTNYVMFELGQPMHAFDLDRLVPQGHPTLRVRLAREGETLRTLDGVVRPLTVDTLVIADTSGPVALAGVMGGADTQVTDDTTTILLESARFDPLSVRRTARRLTMASESSYRFERGIDPTLPHRGGARAAALIAELSGGCVLAGVAEAGSLDDRPAGLVLRVQRLRDVLGIDVPISQSADVLARLGFGVDVDDTGDRIRVSVPSHRLDVSQEIDLVEEVARVVGYDHIPVREQMTIRLAPRSREQDARRLLRQTVAATGYQEAVTFSFVSDAVRDDFLPPDASGMRRVRSTVRRADAHLRPSILPGLLAARAYNESVGAAADSRLFEIASTFDVDRNGRTRETVRVAWVGGADVRSLRGAVEALLHRLDGARLVRVRPSAHRGYAAEACGEIIWGQDTIGFLGLSDEAVSRRLGLRAACPIAELPYEPLVSGYVETPKLVLPPRFPQVRRDISLIVKGPVRFADVRDAVTAAMAGHLEAVEFVDTYRGKPLEAGTKSVTITLVFRATDRTLTGQEVDASVRQVVDSAAARLGAKLRT